MKNRIIQRGLILFMLLLGINSLFAQHTPETLSSQFFETYKEDPTKALNDLFATNVWMAKNQDGVDNLKFKLRENINLMGAYIDYEEIDKSSVGNSLKTIYFMVKYERQPIRFVFRYYKPENTWQIQNFYFDEEL